MRILAMVLALYWGCGSVLADDGRTGAYDPGLNAICALGQTQSDGCAAIRARPILDAASAPWNAIGRVNFASTDTRQHCTGTLISDRVVLTAAHCLYNGARKRWVPPSSVRFLAGYQRGTDIAHANGLRYILPEGQSLDAAFDGDEGRDWALIELAAPVSSIITPLKFAQSPVTGQTVQIAGYAGLRPHVLSQASDCGPLRAASSGLIYGICAAMQGDSGAPVLIRQDGELKIAGVLSRLVTLRNGQVWSEIIPVSLIRTAQK
ncbi:trypsin-like serine peptidase [Phaeobacter marinintestinus]|uniref:trypsin-like serine peptidase n=1 Tax=Falsiphaeobacter marinintestinus TaxID=1492905 RepID=UPI0011B39D9D|nr:trypsin-like serine protease [Phaeobacter marinintestinus]